MNEPAVVSGNSAEQSITASIFVSELFSIIYLNCDVQLFYCQGGLGNCPVDVRSERSNTLNLLIRSRPTQSSLLSCPMNPTLHAATTHTNHIREISPIIVGLLLTSVMTVSATLCNLSPIMNLVVFGDCMSWAWGVVHTQRAQWIAQVESRKGFGEQSSHGTACNLHCHPNYTHTFQDRIPEQMTKKYI
jgi:hypothetical protein